MTLDELIRDWDELNQIRSGNAEVSAKSAAINEVGFLTARAEEVDHNLAGAKSKMETLRRVADQQAIAGPLIGLFSVARSTCGVVPFLVEIGNPQSWCGFELSISCCLF
jgi:hypothetical protein